MVSKSDDFQRMQHLTDVAFAYKSQQEQIKGQLDPTQELADLRERIRKMGLARGETLTEYQIDASISQYKSGQYTFHEPPSGLSTRLANLYVDRARLGRKYGIPALKISALGIGLFLAWNLMTVTVRSISEARAEHAVESLYEKRMSLGTSAMHLEMAESRFPNSANILERIVSTTRLELQSTDDFFEAYCDAGEADDLVTRENMRQVRREAEAIERVLDGVEVKVGVGQELVTVEGTFPLIESIVLDPVYAQRSRDLYGQAHVAAEAMNLRALEATSSELQDINTVLRQDFAYYVVGGQPRKYVDDRGKRTLYYYLILESKDSDGNWVPQRIQSSEYKNQFADKWRWGELVPEPVFERVKKDKADGIIDDDVYARKPFGYHDPIVVMKGMDGIPLTREGQILNWDE